MANAVTTPLVGGSPHHVSNVLGVLTSAQMTTAYPSQTLKTPTKSFAFPFKGHTIAFQKGIGVLCAADLVAALTAASAPVT